MAKCTGCGADLLDGQEFCAGCGREAEGANAGTVAPAVVEAVSPALQVGDRISQAAQVAREAQAAQKPTYDIGDKNTRIGQVIIHGETLPQVVPCAYSGKPLKPEEQYRCPKCHAIICIDHYKMDDRVCRVCTPAAFEAQVTCGLCHQRVPKSDTFECPKCHIVADKGHLDARVNMCSVCADKYSLLVDKLKQGETVVDQKGIIHSGEDYGTLRASRRGLTTATGEQVATIKPQVWYALQWYRVKPGRLHDEEVAMQRFYPDMQLGAGADGTKYWEGPLTTWRGNAYRVRIVYPAFFPNGPPKAYVIEPKIKVTPHIFEDGHLCMFHADDRTWLPTTTAATMVSWVARWLHSYEVWSDTGEWPGEEHGRHVMYRTAGDRWVERSEGPGEQHDQEVVSARD